MMSIYVITGNVNSDYLMPVALASSLLCNATVRPFATDKWVTGRKNLWPRKAAAALLCFSILLLLLHLRQVVV